VVQGRAGAPRRADVPGFTTHTPRHLCLTDLARAGWDIHEIARFAGHKWAHWFPEEAQEADIHEIARFAGHKSTESTLIYIHLSGRDLAERLQRTMAQIHAWGAAELRNGSDVPHANRTAGDIATNVAPEVPDERKEVTE
jgi:integrase/recombinase XerD